MKHSCVNSTCCAFLIWISRSLSVFAGADESPATPPAETLAARGGDNDAGNAQKPAEAELDATPKQVRGVWTITKDTVVSPADPLSLLQLGLRPPEEYVVSMKVRRQSGDNTFALGLPVDGRRVLVVIDAHAGQFSGLEYVDGMPINRQAAARRGKKLELDRDVKLMCIVAKGKLACVVDGVKIADWRGDGLRFSIPRDYAVPDRQALFLATVASQFRISDIRLLLPGDAAPGAAKLMEGSPVVPNLPVDEVVGAPLRIRIPLLGEDELRIFSDRMQWVHGSGLFPLFVTVNDSTWYAKHKPVLEDVDGRSPVPDSLNFQTVEARLNEGMLPVRWSARTDHLAVQLTSIGIKPPEYVISLRNGPEFPKVAQSPEALARLKKSLDRGPRPISPDKTSSVQSDVDSLSHEWRRSRLALAFDKHGKKDAVWAAAGRDYLERIARSPAEPLDDLIAAGQAVIDAGCDDPLLCCEHARRLFETGRPGFAEPLVLHSVLAFERMEYPRRCTRHAPALLASVYRTHTDAGKQAQALRLFQRAVVESAEAACESFAPGHQRAFFEELMDDMQDGPRNPLAGCRSRIAKAVSLAPTADRWLSHMLTAVTLSGPGTLRLPLDPLTVAPNDGSGPLASRVRLARDYLIEAWNLHPEFPEAAARLITVTWDLGRTVPETPRFWFDEAVAAQFDFQEAYERLLDTMRPESGGSNERMIAFGLECAATRRFDTSIPRVLLQAARLVSQGIGSVRPLLAQLGAEKTLFDVMDADERQVESDPANLTRVRTEHMVLCWQISLAQEFRARMKQLNGAPDASVLKDAYLSLPYLQRDADSPAFEAPEIRPLQTFVSFGGVKHIALAPDNRTLVTYLGNDVPLFIWDLVTGKSEPLPSPNRDMYGDLLFTSDGKRLAGLQANNAHVPRQPLLAPDGVAPSGSGTVQIWDFPNLERKELWPVDRYSIFSMAWHPDERMFVVGMGGGFAVVCDADTGRFLAMTDGRGPKASSVAISPDARQLVVGYQDGVTRWYNLPDADQMFQAKEALKLEKLDEAREHQKYLYWVRFSPDGKYLVASDLTSPMSVWDAATRKVIRRIEGDRPVISSDGKYLMTCGNGKRRQVMWNLETGRPLVRLMTTGVGAVSTFSSDGDFVITAGVESYIHVWSIKPYK